MIHYVVFIAFLTAYGVTLFGARDVAQWMKRSCDVWVRWMAWAPYLVPATVATFWYSVAR